MFFKSCDKLRSPVRLLQIIFVKVCEILVSKESLYFLITPGEFYSWKIYRLEDNNENVTSYGNHN